MMIKPVTLQSEESHIVPSRKVILVESEISWVPAPVGYIQKTFSSDREATRFFNKQVTELRVKNSDNPHMCAALNSLRCKIVDEDRAHMGTVYPCCYMHEQSE